VAHSCEAPRWHGLREMDMCLVRVAIDSWGFSFAHYCRLKKLYGAKLREPIDNCLDGSTVSGSGWIWLVGEDYAVCVLVFSIFVVGI
jgi:hypothetical protein